MADTTSVGYVPLNKAGDTATNLVHNTGSIGTAVTAVTQAPSDNSTKVSTTAYADAAAAAAPGTGANTTLSNLGVTAINTSLISDTDVTDDLGSAAIQWNNIYGATAIISSGIELGHATDTTLTRAGAGDVNIEGNIIYRAGGTDVPVTDGGTGASDATNARVNLGLVIGTNVQAYDATLTSIAALGTAADKIAYTTGVDTWAETDLTAQARSLLDDTTQLAQAQTILNNVGVTAATVASTDKILGLDVDDSGNLKSFTAQSIADLAAGTGANTALSNLSSVAINDSLISDTDITDDLGSQSIRWNNIYGATLRTGETATDTLTLDAYDVDGTSWTSFITLTAGNTPTCALSGDVTGVTQSASDNSTKLATTAYVDAAAGGGGGKVLQVVQATKTDTQTISAGAWTDITGLSASITPSSTSNKVLVLAQVSCAAYGAGSSYGALNLVRGSTDIFQGDAASNRTQSTGGFQSYATAGSTMGTICYLDSPASVASTTYKVQAFDVGGTVYINRTNTDTDSSTYVRMASSIILMEIDGT